MRYPWADVAPGQGFFVPCLDTQKTRLEGLQAAAALHIKAQARVAICRGRYGVWFFRPPAPTAPSAETAGSRSA